MTICGESGVGYGERNLSHQFILKSECGSCVVVSGALVYQTRNVTTEIPINSLIPNTDISVESEITIGPGILKW
jgi:hypothetical protein